MNLLVLSPWFPCPPDNGSRLRAFHLIKQWAEAGHRIQLITCLQDDIEDRADRQTLENLCETVQVFPWKWYDGTGQSGITSFLSSTPRSILETSNPPLQAALKQAFAQKPDICIAMQIAGAPYLPLDTQGVPVILEEVEITGVGRSVREAKGLKASIKTRLTKAKHDSYWGRELRRFDALTVVSEEEAVAVKELLGAGAPPIEVVPNGVECVAYPPRNEPPVPGRMIYNGALSYGPNRDAVAWFVREILPKIAGIVPEAHLLVTGKVPNDATDLFKQEPRVQLTGFLPDLRPTLATASLCAVSLLGGGGTRLKILEAWAAGVPVVSTRIGAIGLAGSTDGEHLLLADTASDFADACIRLLQNPNTATRIAANARQLAQERYDWNALAEQVITLAQKLVK